MSKRQCELECSSLADSISSVEVTKMFSPKKRTNLCSRSLKECRVNSDAVVKMGDGPSKNKRPVTICLPQRSKNKTTTCTSGPLLASCTSPLPNQTTLPTSDGPTRINDFIYLGSQSDAVSESVIKTCDITHVLNVTTNSPKSSLISDSNFLRISVNDGQYDQLLPHFNEVFQFIDGTAKVGGIILVHCMAGVSRSATLVIAYLMHRSKIPFNEAYRFVKQKRPNVAPNFNFLGQLMEFEAYLRVQQRSQEVNPCNFQTIAKSFSSPQVAIHGAFCSTPIDGRDNMFTKGQEILTPFPDSDRPFKCSQFSGHDNGSKPIDPSKVSPKEEYINDLSYRCRANSVNQSSSSLSSMGSHESVEIVQVS